MRAKTMAQIEPRNCGLRISDCGFWERETKTYFDFFLSQFRNPKFQIRNCFHRITLSARNSTDCGIVRLSAFAVFEIDNQIEFSRLFHGQIRGLCTFQDPST